MSLASPVVRFVVILLAAVQAWLPAAVSIAHAREAVWESETRGVSRVETPGQHESHAVPSAECGVCIYVAAVFRASHAASGAPVVQRVASPPSARLAISTRAGEGLLPPPRGPPAV